MTAFDRAWDLLKDFYFNPDGIVYGGRGGYEEGMTALYDFALDRPVEGALRDEFLFEGEPYRKGSSRATTPNEVKIDYGPNDEFAEAHPGIDHDFREYFVGMNLTESGRDMKMHSDTYNPEIDFDKWAEYVGRLLAHEHVHGLTFGEFARELYNQDKATPYTARPYRDKFSSWSEKAAQMLQYPGGIRQHKIAERRAGRHPLNTRMGKLPRPYISRMRL
tara:strand:+ start:132 stop:788 length:657 start_codon:yes stop_codon:yes gene_type:complete